MKKIELINKSYLGISIYLANDSDLAKLREYIIVNKPVFDEFKGIIVSLNYGYRALSGRNKYLWNEFFDNVTFLNLDVNRKHTFGTFDLDGVIFDICKENNIEFLFKINHDMIYYPEFLEGDVPDDAEFLYYNGIGYGGMEKYDYDLDRVAKEDFYPQTTQYFINCSKLPELHNKQVITDVYNYTQGIKNYSGRVWEYVDNFSCEDFLKNAVTKNNLVKYHLTKPDTYIRLLNFIKGNNIHDCSHKQLIIDGTCHLQYPEQQLIRI